MATISLMPYPEIKQIDGYDNLFQTKPWTDIDCRVHYISIARKELIMAEMAVIACTIIPN
jgi:hypothetical protein